MTNHQELKNLEAAERKAWNKKMKGSEADACTIYGQEGKNEIEWRKAADECHSYRKQHNLVGLSWREIKSL